MTRFVPIIAVAPIGIAERIAEWASDPAAAEALEPLADLMDSNGWTGEMLMAGTVLAFGVTHGALGGAR